MSETSNDRQLSFAHLAAAHPEWEKIAEDHQKIEAKLELLYGLPIEEFRKVPYRPAPLSRNAPIPGQDLTITQRMVAVRDGTLVNIRIYQPLNVTKGHLLFFNIHGGGWTTGTPETEEEQNRAVAVHNNAIVVSVDYRRAPEFPFPYALNDSYDVLKWAKKSAASLGADSERIIVGGGSAGANVATVLTQIARDEGLSGIIGQVLNIPVTCHPDHFPVSKYEYNSYCQNAFAPIVNASRMRLFWKNYLPNAEADPRASPLLASSLAGLPPALVQVAGMDPLRDEGFAYSKALEASGIDVTLKVYPGLPHAFYVYADMEPSVTYCKTVVEWIERLVRMTGE